MSLTIEACKKGLSNTWNSRPVQLIGSTINCGYKAVRAGAALGAGFVASAATVETARYAQESGLFGQPVYNTVAAVAGFVGQYVPLRAASTAVSAGCELAFHAVPSWAKALTVTVLASVVTYEGSKSVRADLAALWAARPGATKAKSA